MTDSPAPNHYLDVLAKPHRERLSIMFLLGAVLAMWFAAAASRELRSSFFTIGNLEALLTHSATFAGLSVSVIFITTMGRLDGRPQMTRVAHAFAPALAAPSRAPGRWLAAFAVPTLVGLGQGQGIESVTLDAEVLVVALLATSSEPAGHTAIPALGLGALLLATLLNVLGLLGARPGWQLIAIGILLTVTSALSYRRDAVPLSEASEIKW